MSPAPQDQTVEQARERLESAILSHSVVAEQTGAFTSMPLLLSKLIDALIAACLRRSGAQRRDEQKDDQGAGLIGQIASPLAETQPRLNRGFALWCETYASESGCTNGTIDGICVTANLPFREWCPECLVGHASKLLREYADAIEARDREIGQWMHQAIEACQVVRDTLWMAGRYADGRRSYAVSMYNRAREIAERGGYAQGAQAAKGGIAQVGRVPVVEEEKDHHAALAAGENGPCLEAPREARDGDCPLTEHADGKSHTWRRFTPTQFQCWWCGELRDATNAK